VSNFTVALIDEAVAKCSEPLFTNQIEYHAYICQDKVVDACNKHGLLVTCHVPLARGAILEDPVICNVADTHGKTAAQVALRWLVQQPNMVVVPRALEHSEIKENIDIFDFKLTVNEMEKISELRNNNLRIVDPEVRRPVWDEV
jgi:diketogulonate reductase-like aldo/keto reductase